ncbi:MAG: arylsulfatase [Okeania sp. SIO2C9]|uniref:arylsulfatase n=1 Tax=Okeania sp. SIO2C9 TaxID=2607791 RepID=UPI0013C08D60|nr:arylsulfatase [Okeania sp. SIO2C9]NEQ72646.1 arylsulfatase [Okeania sp. SIO2C9]
MFLNGFLNRICRGIVAIAIALSFFLNTAVLPAMAQQILPHPDPIFTGEMGLTYEDSQSEKADLKLPSTFGIENAPNILVVMLDDVGYGQMSTFGGAISSPTLEKLADNGLRYTQFHTTGICSPTRAALLTGRNAHSVASGAVMEAGTNFPGYSTLIPQNAATIGQILQSYGYATSWFGKNHNTPDWETGAIGPFDRWPVGLGFDYFYGFVGGETNQYHPALVENTTRLEAPKTNADGSPYIFNTDLADHAINYIRTTYALSDEKPFFMFFAPGATHAPHQVSEDYIKNFAGEFDTGWDEYRSKTFEKQKELGVIPANAVLTPRQDLRDWDDDLDADEKRLYARMMEVFAGFTQQTDEEIGRVIDAIEDLGLLDNTLVIYIAGDNGASAEGGVDGTINTTTYRNGLTEDFDDKLAAIDELGSSKHDNHFPAGWAWAMDTPFQWTKQVASHFGGTRNGMVVSWPDRITDKGDVRYQFSHVIDIVPTILEAVGIEAPTQVNGVTQKPIEGTSLVYTFDATDTEGNDISAIDAPSEHTTQYFEIAGNQGIYDNGWMASAIRTVPWQGNEPLGNSLIDMDWELYNVNGDADESCSVNTPDFTQANDLAEECPDKLDEMVKLFYAEAAKHNVFPLDDRRYERFDPSLRPSLVEGRTHFIFPDHFRAPEGVAPNLKSKSHTITADVVFPPGGEGVLVTLAGAFGGYGLFVQDGKLVYDYNLARLEHYRIEGSLLEIPVPTIGLPITLKAVYQTVSDEPGVGGEVTLYADGQQIGHGFVCETLSTRYTPDETFDVGFDTGSAVSESYVDLMPFDFTGTLNSVTIEITDDLADKESVEAYCGQPLLLNPIPFYD